MCFCNPGFFGEDCSVLTCPGEPACNMRGKSLSGKESSLCVYVTLGLLKKTAVNWFVLENQHVI